MMYPDSCNQLADRLFRVSESPGSRGSNKVTLQNQVKCRRCGRTMQKVAEIFPFGRDPGLLAFICDNCGESTSTLIDPPKQ